MRELNHPEISALHARDPDLVEGVIRHLRRAGYIQPHPWIACALRMLDLAVSAIGDARSAGLEDIRLAADWCRQAAGVCMLGAGDEDPEIEALANSLADWCLLCERAAWRIVLRGLREIDLFELNPGNVRTALPQFGTWERKQARVAITDWHDRNGSERWGSAYTETLQWSGVYFTASADLPAYRSEVYHLARDAKRWLHNERSDLRYLTLSTR